MEHEGEMLGRYRIVRSIGEGGMGRVYLAHDPRLNRDVAVKIILETALWESSVLRRFEREIRAAAAVTHPHLVRVFDQGVTEGRRWFAMDHVEGVNLKTLLERRGRLDVEEIRRVALEIGSALQALHDAGILHRDLKPANVMRRDDGSHVLMDLGLAKSLGATALTASHEMLGTPKFMSAEMILGTPLDERSDLYQLGLLLWTLAVGRLPSSMGSFLPDPELLERARTLPPLESLRPDLPIDLTRAIDAAVAYRPEGRPRSVRDFLRRIGGEEHVEAAPSPEAPRPAATSGPMTVIAGDVPSPGHAPRTAGLFLLVLTFGIGTVLWFSPFSPSGPASSVRNVTVLPGVGAVRVQWESARPMRTALRIETEGEASTRTLREEGEARRFHSVLVEDLDPRKRHRALVVDGDRPLSLAHRLVPAPALTVEGPTVDLGQGWPPLLTWRLSPPACAILALRRGGREEQLAGPITPHPEVTFRIEGWTPKEALEDLRLELTAIGGRRKVVELGTVNGLAGLWTRLVSLRFPEGPLEAFRRPLSAANDLDRARALLAEVLEERGLLELYGEVLQNAPEVFATAPLADRLALHASLLDFERVDQLAFLRFDAPLWNVAKRKLPFVEVTPRASMPEADPPPLLHLELPERKDYFFPANLSDELMEERVERVRLLLPVDKTPYRSLAMRFEVPGDPAPKAGHLEVSFEAHAFFTRYVFELRIDDAPPVLVFNREKDDDQGITLGAAGAMDAAGPRLTIWRAFTVRLPAEISPPGRHTLRLTLQSLEGAGNLLTGVRTIGVRIR